MSKEDINNLEMDAEKAETVEKMPVDEAELEDVAGGLCVMVGTGGSGFCTMTGRSDAAANSDEEWHDLTEVACGSLVARCPVIGQG